MIDFISKRGIKGPCSYVIYITKTKNPSNITLWNGKKIHLDSSAPHFQNHSNWEEVFKAWKKRYPLDLFFPNLVISTKDYIL
jgi:hypothetical protein